MPGVGDLQDFLETTESPIVIDEPQLEKRGRRARAQLRSIPFFREFGIDSFVYDDLWAQTFPLVSHDHTGPNEVSVEDVQFPIVHLVTSEQLQGRDAMDAGHEDISQASVTWDLLERSAASDDLYVLVTDSTAPAIPSETPVAGRSAADHFEAEAFEFRQLLRDYVRANIDSGIPVNETRNLFFHRVSEHHRANGLPGDTITDLFEYDRVPADSPVWDPLYYFIEHELDELLEDYEAHITESLRSWVEWGETGSIARRMIATLHRCDFDREQLEAYQQGDNR